MTRNKLIKEELLGDIFEEVKKMMESKRLILNEGTLIDVTLIHSSTREMIRLSQIK